MNKDLIELKLNMNEIDSVLKESLYAIDRILPTEDNLNSKDPQEVLRILDTRNATITCVITALIVNAFELIISPTDLVKTQSFKEAHFKAFCDNIIDWATEHFKDNQKSLKKAGKND